MVGSVHTRKWAVTVWLATLGLASAIVGGHDAVAASEVNARLFGTLVLAGGAVLIVGAVGLHGGRPVGRALATVAAVLGVALGVLIFIAQVVNDEPDGLLAVWAAIILLSAVAVRMVHRDTPADERAEGVWSQLPVLKSAISLGLLISAAQFWYTSIYVPTTAPANLTLESKVEAVPASGDQLAVRGAVTIRNTSGTRVNVLASSLELLGDELVSIKPDRRQFRLDIGEVDRGNYTTAERYAGSARLEKVAHSPLVGAGTYFEPGEVVTVPLLTQVPQGRFNTLRLEANLVIARGKVLAAETQTEEPETIKTEKGVVILTAIPEAGWLRRLTRGDRFVRTEYPSDPSPESTVPKVAFSPDRDPHPNSDFDDRLTRFYGVSELTSQAIDSPLPAK